MSEAEQALSAERTYDTWQQGFLQIFQYALDNRSFVQSTYHSVGREHLERFLYTRTYNLLRGVVDEKCADMAVREEDLSFMADFYKYAFVGLVLDWVGNGMREDPQRIISRLSILLEGDIPQALQRFRTDTI